MARTPHLRHVRYRQFDRLRHGSNFAAWLAEQAARLSVTPRLIYDTLLVAQQLTAEQVEQVTLFPGFPTVVPGTIAGTLTAGSTLTVTPTVTGTPTPVVTYQWFADAVAIAGATLDNYVIVAGDSGKAITCTITATNSIGVATGTTAAVTAA